MFELAAQLKSAVHLCVDMQRLFAAEGPWPTPWMDRVLPQALKLAERAPERTIFTRFLTPHISETPPGLWRDYYAKWPQARRGVIDEALLDLLPVLARLAPPAKVFD